MKKFTIFLFLLALVFSSCGDDFLTLSPTSSIDEDSFYKTEEDIYAALIAAYDPLQWDDFYGGYSQLQFMSDIRSDDVFVGGDGAASFHHEMADYNMDPAKSPETLWKLLYTGVNRSNLVIEKMDEVEDISDENKNRYLAEAHYLRAYYYHWLWKFWGNVPYYTVNMEDPYGRAPQYRADDIYTKIMEDLDFALEGNKLPATVPSPELGRITSWAAMMLQARVVMYQNDESRYQEVYDNMLAIKNSSQFSLLSDFSAIWLNENEHCSESIWEVNYRSEGGSWGYSEGGEGTVYPKFIGIPGLSNDPEYQDGWGYEPIRREVYNLYSDDDTRKEGGVINFEKRQRELEEQQGITISYSARYEDTGLFNRKYTARRGYNDAPYDVELNFNNNVRVFRYSEALLNLAELALKLGRNDAQECLDIVRLRAFGNDPDKFSANRVTATEENIFRERRLEFLGEGLRFWDLVRTGRTNLLTETNEFWSRQWSDYLKYLPIPSIEIDRTDGEYKLVQNSGYPGGASL